MRRKVKLLLVIDIDGTLADIRSRSVRAGSMPPREQRHLFQAWLDRLQSIRHLASDKPIPQSIHVIKLLCKSPAVKAVYLTGRSERYRKATLAWLKKQKAPSLPLHMRALEDWRPAAEYKKEKMLEVTQGYKPNQVLVLDDDGDGDCSAMYTSLGYTHYKVLV